MNLKDIYPRVEGEQEGVRSVAGTPFDMSVDISVSSLLRGGW